MVKNMTENKVVDGRTVSASTHWWLKNAPYNSFKLFCIHNIDLDKFCYKCKGK